MTSETVLALVGMQQIFKKLIGKGMDRVGKAREMEWEMQGDSEKIPFHCFSFPNALKD